MNKSVDQVIPLFYRGPISASKSLMNRALIVKSFFPQLELIGDSNCEDVSHMKNALQVLSCGSREIFCGEAGTVFRFIALRASREIGEWTLMGTKRLMERPHQDVINLLDQLGVVAELTKAGLFIKSSGWKPVDSRIKIHREKSSQFATGFLMSCWKLPFDVEIELTPAKMKDSYWEMSLQMAQDLGMRIKENGPGQYVIPANQNINTATCQVEPDMSSAFSVAALAALIGDFHLQPMPRKSLQPDFKFVEILNQMKISTAHNNELTVSCTDQFYGVEINMEETPDLFPVLSILCAFAEGKSTLYGAPRLAFKESNRILKTSELLNLMGVKNEPQSDGIIIYGNGRAITQKKFKFDPDHDHRMAMAAGILLRLGWPIQIHSPDVVKKSFPEFWKVIGVQP